MKKFTNLICRILIICLFLTQVSSMSLYAEEVKSDDEIYIQSLIFKDAELNTVLQIIAQENDINILAGPQIKGRVTVKFNNVSLRKALKQILLVNGYDYIKEGNIYRVVKIDKPKTSKKKEQEFKKITKHFKLKHIKVGAVIDKVRSMKSPVGQIFTDNRTNSIIVMDGQQYLLKMARIIKMLDVEDEFEKPIDVEKHKFSYTFKNADVEEAKKTLTEFLDEGEKVIQDKRTNSIFIICKKENTPNIRSFLVKIDKKIPQVMIEAKILEVNLTDDKSFGFNMNFTETLGGDRSGLKSEINQSAYNVSQFDYSNTLQYGALTHRQFQLTLNTIRTKNNSKLLSAPKITVLNNEQAVLSVKDKIPYVKTEISTQTGGNVGSQNVEYKDVPVELTVTPQINEDNFITLKVKAQIESRSGESKNGEPIIAARETDTIVSIKDGYTLVIGGMIKNDFVDFVEKTPILGDIPILNRLFKKNTKKNQITEIIIFITPRIIKNSTYKDDENYFNEVIKSDFQIKNQRFRRKLGIKEDKVIIKKENKIKKSVKKIEKKKVVKPKSVKKVAKLIKKNEKIDFIYKKSIKQTPKDSELKRKSYKSSEDEFEFLKNNKALYNHLQVINRRSKEN